VTATRGALSYFESRARVYRHTWRASVISSFLNPVMFLAAMGLGLGSLVDGGTGDPALRGFTYLAFLAPGLMAATAMQAAAGDSSWPVMAGIKWLRTYDGVLATPMEVGDIMAGHLSWVTTRTAFVVCVYGLVGSAFGAFSVPRALLASVPATLTGLAVGAAVLAFTTGLENDTSLSSLFRFGITPMFLFSGTFFPITQLPAWIRPLAWLTPLWHGVELTRSAALGTPSAWPWMVHALFLLAVAAGGLVLATARLERRLVK